MYHVTGMGEPMDLQMLLYKNGNIKFQYIQPVNDGTSRWGVAGVENADASDYTQCFSNQGFISGNTAILLRPEIKQEIQAGESHTFTLTVDARRIKAGVFNTPLIFKSNDPVAPKLTIPAQLTVNGVAQFEEPTAFDFGEIMAIETEEWPYTKAYKIEKSYKNPGSAPLTVNSISMQNLPASATVEAYMETIDWFGNKTMAWMNINWAAFSTTIDSESELKVRVTLMPGSTESGAVDGSITVDTDNPATTEASVVAVTASIISPPALLLTNKVLDVTAHNATHTETQSFTVDNTNGGSLLEYNILLNFIREGEVEKEAEEPPPFIESLANIASQPINGVPKLSNEKRGDEFNRILEHDTQDESSTKLGFGQSRGLEIGTAFKAPADGFNLTHVKTWYVPGSWKKSEITVKIYSGQKLKNSIKLAQQEVQYNIEQADETGQFVTFELNEPLKIFPNERFFVVFKYPLGAEYPQGVASFDDPIQNTFFYKYEEDDEFVWVPLERDLPQYGWMVKAIEKNAEGNYWAMINGETNGTLNVGEILTVNVNFDAQYAEAGLQQAYAKVITNDPYLPADSVHLKLYRNQAPAFKTVDGNNKIMETETTTFEIGVEDPDGDSFSLTLEQDYQNTSLTGNGDGIYTFTYSPDYEEAGMHSFNLVAEDAGGFTNDFTFYVKVYDKNRMPVTATITDKEYLEGDNFETITVADVFTDADMDELTIDTEIENIAIAQVIAKDGKFHILPLTEGETVVTMVATDGRSEPVITTFNVTVLNKDALNQQPIALTIADRTYDIDANMDYIPFAALFSDADGDALTYDVSVTTDGIISVSHDNSTISISPEGVGTTTLTVTATDGKSDPVTLSVTISVDNLSSITDTDNAVEVKVYPNPVADYATIAYNLASSENINIRLIDINGKTVMIERATSAKSHILKTQHLNSGVYMISIEQNGKQVAVKRIVKK